MTARRVIEARLEEIAALLGEVGDVLAERAESPAPPAWAERLGWSGFLLGIDDDTLEAAETRGPAAVLEHAAGAPPSLRELARRVRAATALPTAFAARTPSSGAGRGAGERAGIPTRRRGRRARGTAEPREERRQARPRKRAQVAALDDLVGRWSPPVERVVDLGAGKGHLTRALADALGVPAVGIERAVPVVETARRLTFDERVRFVRGDAAETVDVGPTDLLVGLHACGALGDALIERAAQTGAAALLVSCCYQKVPGGAREPLSARGRRLGLRFDATQLGLANLATVAEGAAGGRAVMARRRTRYALWLALRDAGIELAPGDEARGVNRRQFRRPLAALAPVVFAAHGLPAPSPAALRDAEDRAAREHARIRRLALARTMLARPLELAVVLDRATALCEAGGGADVIEAFSPTASPRNVAIARDPVDEARTGRS